MTTSIGQALAESRHRLIAATFVGLLTVAGDLTLVWQHLWYERGVLPLIAMAVLSEIVRGDLPSLGFKVTPYQGWGYWVRITLLFGLVIAAVLTAWAWMLMAAGYDLPIITTPASAVGGRLWQMCVYSPILE